MRRPFDTKQRERSPVCDACKQGGRWLPCGKSTDEPLALYEMSPADWELEKREWKGLVSIDDYMITNYYLVRDNMLQWEIGECKKRNDITAQERDKLTHQITIERRMRKNFTTRFVRKVANERKLGVLTKDYGKVYHKDK